MFFLLFLFALCFYFLNLERFLLNLQIDSESLIFVIYINFLLLIPCGYISKIIFDAALKYGAYKFLFLLLIVINFIAYLLFRILVLVLILIYEIGAIFVNFCASFGNNYEDKYSLNLDKFKNATYEEKMPIISFFVMISGTALGGETLKEDVLSHKKNGQRIGKKKFIINKENLDILTEKIGEVIKKKILELNL